MQIRLTPLEDQNQYFLDNAVSCGDMLAHTQTALEIYGDPVTIASLLKFDKPYMRSRHESCLRLSDYADQIIAALPVERREALIALGVRSALRQAEEIAECCSNWAIEDETSGGAMLPFRQRPRLTHGGLPTKGVVRRLRSRSWIARYVRREEQIARLTRLARRLLAHPITESSSTMDAIAAVQIDLGRQLKAFRLFWSQDRGWRERNAEMLALDPSYRGVTPVQPYRVIRKRRKVVKRAAVMAAALLGAGTVGAFARGEPITIPGQELGLRLTLIGQMADRGHGRLSVELLDKAGEHLGNLCVYIDQTPALDQLTAFALHMQSGLEREIATTGNLMRVTTAGERHPILAERVAKRAEGTRVMARTVGTWENRRALQTAYWHATRGVWIREVSIVAFGRRWPQMTALLAEDAMAPGYDLPIPEEVAGLI